MVARVFQNIPDEKVSEADQQSFLVNLGWSRASTWDDLLRSKRVLLISEAGAGKTYECRDQARRLWNAGEPAFFIELAALATEQLRSSFDSDEEVRLDAWLASQSDVATFFLDSIDELKLTLGSFERSLKRFKKCIGNQLHRSRIVITTRPIYFDRQLIRNVLPVPPIHTSGSDAETFAAIAMRSHERRRDEKSDDVPPVWRSVALMPLSDQQIIEFARDQGVNDPDLLLADLRRRNALEFARRPQDLIELCADWREHKRIRTHRDQVATNVRVKLLASEGRPEPAELSIDKAIEGASRLALAAQLTRRLTIRHSAASDAIEGDAALDPAIILPDWQPNERRALLERPLFGFSSYGRVRFHHRSVTEYLAAERLLTLRKKGMPFRALKRVIFADSRGKIIARPSKRSIAGWLAIGEPNVFELLRDNEPAVLLNEGDPESLSQMQRSQALRAYCKRYGPGGWRSLEVPQIQIHRFASEELASEINRIWKDGVENPDVREVLLSLIEAGPILACADIAFHVSRDIKAPRMERLLAFDALVSLDDNRLNEFAVDIARADDRWPDQVARGALLRLFPRHMSVEQLCQTLRWVKRLERSVGGLSWQLPRLIATSALDIPTLEELRDGLVMLISEGIEWRREWPHITCDRTDLSAPLAATCERGLESSTDDRWFHAGALAVRLHHGGHGDEEPIKSLRARLINLDATLNARLFWVMDAWHQSLHEDKDPSSRFAELTTHDGPLQLKPDRDSAWIKESLGDTIRDVAERALLLEAAIRLVPNRKKWREHVIGLKPLIADDSCLSLRIDEWLKPSTYDEQHDNWERRQIEKEKEKKRLRAENRASWIDFWTEVATRPEDAFSSEQGRTTAWNLWRVMRHDGDDSRSSGWNRRFIEKQFSREAADRLCLILMETWRDDTPTLPSERTEQNRNSYFVQWQLGLAAIYAEAEDSNWATHLSDSEARLASRYVLIELNGFPHWLEAVASAHPLAVTQTLGDELSWELKQPPDTHGYSRVLHGIGYATEGIAKLFLLQLESWFDAGGDLVAQADNAIGMTERIRQVTRIIYKHGDDIALDNLKRRALQRLEGQLPYAQRLVWLGSLMRINPSVGIDELEAQIELVEPAERSEAVALFAGIFGDRQDAIGFDDERFTPKLLLRLLRLAYRHVRIQDDAYHKGPYSPDVRDDAENARNRILTALFNAKGEEGFAAKLEMSADPLCAHFKDRVLAVAEENWAQEIDAHAYSDSEAIALDRTGEAPAATNEAMFSILKDRLSDLDELLLSDASPRQAWAEITDEKVMRREIARELRHASNSIYTVDQEAVTADEKETDIRLRSTSSTHEAVIEIKLGDRRTAKDLLNAIEDQLVRKYMAAGRSRAGTLLVTLAKGRKWRHPSENRMIKPEELLELLNDEADRVQQASGGELFIGVHLLDLRARLPVESQAKTVIRE